MPRRCLRDLTSAALGAMILLAAGCELTPALAAGPATLPGVSPLQGDDDLAVRMMDGLHRFAERRIDASIETRPRFWQRDTSSPAAYERSVAANREHLANILGVVDGRLPPQIERFGDDANPALVADTGRTRIWQVRWPVLGGVTGEGLLLEPRVRAVGFIVVLPDADQTPEQAAGLAPASTGARATGSLARRLVERGFEVVVPVMISRANDVSGDPRVAMTNQPHREWIWRQAYHMGRHVIGYEVQKVLALVDGVRARAGGAGVRVGVAGEGEGGLVALAAAALDPRIDAALVSAAFRSRQRTWEEPIYRNVWGLLREFGDAEIASLVAPRGLVVEHSAGPRVDGPPPVVPGRKPGAAVGKIETPSGAEVTAEWRRLDALVPASLQRRELVMGEGGATVAPGSAAALGKFATLLGARAAFATGSDAAIVDRRRGFDARARQARQVKQLEAEVQGLVHSSATTRRALFLGTTTAVKDLGERGQWFRKARVPTSSPQVFAREAEPFRQKFWNDVLGRIEDAPLPPAPRARVIYDRPTWTGHEVVLDVFPDVFAWGVLLVPKGIKPGERRPVVVTQHGRNGVPKETIEGDNWAYHDFAARLAEQGFVVFSPHNPYRGEDRYRILNRKANATGTTLFSFILAQHRQSLAWLSSLPFVDGKRIGFYGLSYGGETAMRVPTLLTEYALSICSGDFNDWARKVAATDSDYSFMYSIEWEMPYFNMGSTFGYAEMAYLMVPRPFMVERGHHDGVAPDEWVASEYAKVRWLYAQLGMPERTDIEFYGGGHTINGQGTFAFLRKHLGWRP